MATHSRILAWRIPGTGESEGLQGLSRFTQPESGLATIQMHPQHLTHVLIP